jgi:soluble lytic murein transglycosylase
MQFRTILTLIASLAIGVLSNGAQAQPGADGKAVNRVDAQLLDMQQAFNKGDRKRLGSLLPQVRGHALEPWAAYWELKARLEDAPAQEVQDFFLRYAGSYQEDRLRNDWLLLLGQRRDWSGFSANYPSYRMGDDRELRCYAAMIANSQGAADQADEVRRSWYALREADLGCTQAAAALFAANKLSPVDVWRKARLAMEANRPRSARNAVELVAPEFAQAVTEINNNAAKYLSARVLVPGKTRKELVVLAIIKMATNDADATAAVLDAKWSVHLSPEERNWAWGVVGKQAAMHIGSEALSYYAHVTKDTDLNDEMLAWKARSALRGGKAARWPLVLSSINAMSEEGRRDPTWVYWKARALQQGKSATELAQAAVLFESIASVRGFYEQLALEELGRKITVPPPPAPLTPEELETARLNPGLNRALMAIALGLRSEGVREWNYSTNLSNPRAAPGGMSERELLAAADMACRHQVWDRCINTSERTRTEIDFAQRFPMPHREAVLKRSQEIGLDPAYVYGLIRQESRFIMDARSGVGASGLMQVMPPTARWTAKKIGLVDFKAHQISDRDTNIAIGTGYLKLVLDDFAGSMPLAAAAYNAGPSRPRNWRGSSGGPVMEAAIWAENVPFNETRDYVKKVLSNTTNYAALISGQPQSLKARLGMVGPRDAAAPEVNAELP